MNIEIKDISNHKITISKNEVRLKISKSKIEEQDAVIKAAEKILEQVQYDGYTLRGYINISCPRVSLHKDNKTHYKTVSIV